MSAAVNARLHVVHVFTVADSLLFLSGQAAHMRAAGVEIAVVSSPGAYQGEFCKAEGVEAVSVGMSRSISPLRDLGAVISLVRVFRARRPQVVHAHTPKAGLLGMIAAAIAGVPVRIYHMRGLPLETLSGMRRALMTITERISCTLAHRVFCVSPSLRTLAGELGLCSPGKMVVFEHGSSNGVDAVGRFAPRTDDADVRRQYRHGLSIPEDAAVIVCVGRLARDKGIEELALAWAELRSAYDRAYLVLVGGEDGRDAISSPLYRSLLDDSRVRFAGPTLDVRPAYVAADVVVHPSHREGFPNVPLEAAAMMLPVVTTNATGCIDAVVDGRTGTIVPVGNVKALARAIASYVVDPELRQTHGQAARDRALRDFSPQRIWDAMLREYQSLARGAHEGAVRETPAERAISTTSRE